MDEKEAVEFEKKVVEEIQKRKDIVAEADEIVQKIEQHYQDKKVETECIDVERNAVINEIHDITKTKDISKLDELFERLR
jgi:malate synthase